MLRMLDGEHGAGGFAHHALRHAADQQMAKPGAAMRPHDDEIHPGLARVTDDFDEWHAVQRLMLYGQSKQGQMTPAVVCSIIISSGGLRALARHVH